jgi:threonine dehydrogenase-like Zn-dependent dehydrogenase
MAAMGFFPGPFPVGHETVAEVIAIGDEVSARRVGERVLVPFQVSCGACVACLDGRFGACHTYRARAGVRLDSVRPVAVTAGQWQTSSRFRPLITCSCPRQMAEPARSAPCQTTPATPIAPSAPSSPSIREVLIVGGAAASIALYAVAFARALGSARVRYVDSDEERCAAAAALGGEVEHRQGPWPRRYDRAPITVEASGELEGLTTALRSTDDYGFCTAVAIHFAPAVPLPLLEMYTHGITFHLSRADSRRLLPVVLELFAEGRFDPLAAPTTIVPWDRADEVWLEPATKLVLERE